MFAHSRQHAQKMNTHRNEFADWLCTRPHSPQVGSPVTEPQSLFFLHLVCLDQVGVHAA